MKRTVTIFVYIIVMLSGIVRSNAQTLDDIPKLSELKGKKLLEKISPLQHKKGLWGYANSEGKFIIRPEFNLVMPYEGKVARVNFKGKWGVINEKAQYVVPPIFYNHISEFSSDSLSIVKSQKWGLMNSRSKIIQALQYDTLMYANYGYLSLYEGKYGTIDKKGATILEPQFDDIRTLDAVRTVDQIFKNGKWGLLKDGAEILSLQFDDPVILLQKGIGDRLDLYLATQRGKTGVVTTYGDFVVPCVYDEIYKAPSGDYYITRQDEFFGAISLKMDELVPPMLESAPVITEDIFRVHNDGRFYAANINGAVPFEDCANLYEIFKPEEYAATTSIPEWAKNSIIENNVFVRDSIIDNARQLIQHLAATDYKVPDGMQVTLPEIATGHYGVMSAGVFKRSSGTLTDGDGNKYESCYVSDSDNGKIYLLTDYTGDPLVKVKDDVYSVAEAVEKLNLKNFTAFYPQSYMMLKNNRIGILFSFVRPQGDVGTSMIETDEYLLPVEKFEIKVHKGSPVPASESKVLVVYDLSSLDPVGCYEIQGLDMMAVRASVFGGFYTYGSGPVIVDSSHPLDRFDRFGNPDWKFTPGYGEQFYDIEETESFIYLSGMDRNMMPIVTQLNKRGERVKDLRLSYENAWMSGVICKDNILYGKVDFKNDRKLTEDYYPFFVLEDIGDHFGVNLVCAWEDWGGAEVGGCGLVSSDGRWLSAPVLLPDQTCNLYGWQFGQFVSDHLVVIYNDRYGLIDRTGKMVIEPIYDDIEILDNPSFVKVKLKDKFGVLNVDGRVIVPVEYDYVGRMSEDIIIVKQEDKYGCFDKEGKLVTPVESEEIKEYHGGMARIRLMGRYGFMDKTGNIVVAPFSDEVENFSEDFVLVTIKDKLGFVTFSGDWIVVPMYDDGSSFSGGLAYLSYKGKYGYVDTSGEFVIPMKYDGATDFNIEYGLACVSQKGKWGVINRKGEVVVPIRYDEVTIAADGYIRVQSGDKFGIYSKEGKVIYPVASEGLSFGKDGSLFRYGVAQGRLGDLRVQIDICGNRIFRYSAM